VLKVNLACNASQQTWTNEPGPNEQRPINCVSWYEAFAFCTWDEGRLPTEAEWQYAAVGGAQSREFAWGTTDLMQNFAPVCLSGRRHGHHVLGRRHSTRGPRQDGNGRFRQSDLTGSMYEWTLDWNAPYPKVMRDDYAKTDVGTERVLRGGAWNSTKVEVMRSTDRTNRQAPDFRSTATGIRCVHDREGSVH
jgi:formylglycine-generating enzyme